MAYLPVETAYPLFNTIKFSSMNSLVDRPHLATLTEAIDITREAWRKYLIDNLSLSKDVILNAIDDSNEGNDFKQKVRKVRKGELRVEDILDINCGSYLKLERSQDISCHTKEKYRTAISELRKGKIRIYRNEICHPPYEDILCKDLKPKLKRIQNFLEGVISTSASNIDAVKRLMEQPFSQSHLCDATEKHQLKQELGQIEIKLQTAEREIIKFKEDLKEAKVQNARREHVQQLEAEAEVERLNVVLGEARQAGTDHQLAHKNAEAQKVQLGNEADRLRNSLEEARKRCENAEHNLGTATAHVQQLEENVTSLNSELDGAAKRLHEMEQTQTDLLEKCSRQVKLLRRRALLRPLWSSVLGTAIGLLLVSTLAIFQPGQLQQMLFMVTSVISPILAPVPEPNFGTAEWSAGGSEADSASLAAALQRAEEELASKVNTETESAEVRVELERAKIDLTTAQAEVLAQNTELETLTAELATVRNVLLNTEKALEVIKAEQADASDAVTREQIEVLDVSVTTLIDATGVRVGPGTEFEIVETLPKGATVQLIGIDASGDWYLLSPSSWVSAANVGGRIPESLPVATLGRVLVDANLRQEPTTVSPVLETARQGQIIVLVGQQEGSQPAGTWYQLDSGHWIFGDLVAELPTALP